MDSVDGCGMDLTGSEGDRVVGFRKHKKILYKLINSQALQEQLHTMDLS
jgi:hypothetical protein